MVQPIREIGKRPVVDEETELMLPPMLVLPWTSNPTAQFASVAGGDVTFDWYPPSLLIGAKNTNTGSTYVINITYVEFWNITSTILTAKEFDIDIGVNSILPANGIIGRTRSQTYYRNSTSTSNSDQNTITSDIKAAAAAAMNNNQFQTASSHSITDVNFHVADIGVGVGVGGDGTDTSDSISNCKIDSRSSYFNCEWEMLANKNMLDYMATDGTGCNKVAL